MKTEKIIKDKIDYISQVMFYIMEIEQEAFGFSWEQINEAFCRLLLRIPFDQKIADKDVLEFQNIVLKKRKEYDLIGADPESLWGVISGEYFDFPEGRIPVYAQDRVSNLLEKVGSKKRLVTGLYGGKIGYIFGEISCQEMGEHEVCIIEKEEARTPNRVLELVAVVLGEKIYLRRESFRNLFLNNWLSFFDTPQLKINKILAKEETNILYHLRQKALELYGINSRDKLLTLKEELIEEMLQLTLHHEIGHREVQRALSLDEFAIGSALSNLGENIASTLGELLADWSKEGPIWYALNKNSSALLYLYLADKCFLGTKDLSLQFTATLNFDLPSLKSEAHLIYEKLWTAFKELIQEVKQILEEMDYQIAGRKVSFEAFAAGLKAKFKETDGYLEENSSAFKNAFWYQILSRGPQDLIRQFLKTKKNFFKDGTAELKRLGFYQPQPPLPLEEIYKIACYEMGLYQDEAEKVFLEYFKVIQQGGLDLRGAYQYLEIEPCLFFALLRFMLKKIGIIPPLTALTFGAPLEDKKKIKDKEQDLRTRIEKLVAFLKKEKITKLPLLRIEKNYLTESRMRQILAEYHLEASLLQFVTLPHNFIFEVYLEPRPDFLDSILVNGIREVNQKIRPQETEKLFSLDKKVLEHLGSEYLKI